MAITISEPMTFKRGDVVVLKTDPKRVIVVDQCYYREGLPAFSRMGHPDPDATYLQSYYRLATASETFYAIGQPADEQCCVDAGDSNNCVTIGKPRPAEQEDVDRAFLRMAEAVANMSAEPNKGGAVIVRDGVVIGAGYNGLPQAYEGNSLVPPSFKLAASERAIIGTSIPLLGATMYCWPCQPGTRGIGRIVEAGISRVVWPVFDIPESLEDVFDRDLDLLIESGVDTDEIEKDEVVNLKNPIANALANLRFTIERVTRREIVNIKIDTTIDDDEDIKCLETLGMCANWRNGDIACVDWHLDIEYINNVDKKLGAILHFLDKGDVTHASTDGKCLLQEVLVKIEKIEQKFNK